MQSEQFQKRYLLACPWHAFCYLRAKMVPSKAAQVKTNQLCLITAPSHIIMLHQFF